MDPLPLELAAIVIENLIEYDLAPTSTSQFTEEPCNKLLLIDQEVRTENWMKMNTTSRIDLLNARLARRK
jgi:hypothetical protein